MTENETPEGAPSSSEITVNVLLVEALSPLYKTFDDIKANPDSDEREQQVAAVFDQLYLSRVTEISKLPITVDDVQPKDFKKEIDDKTKDIREKRKGNRGYNLVSLLVEQQINNVLTTVPISTMSDHSDIRIAQLNRRNSIDNRVTLLKEVSDVFASPKPDTSVKP